MFCSGHTKSEHYGFQTNILFIWKKGQKLLIITKTEKHVCCTCRAAGFGQIFFYIYIITNNDYIISKLEH